MRCFAVAVALGVTLFAAPMFAGAAQGTPAAPGPRAAAAPGQPTPAAPPAAPAVFPAGAKYAFINIQRIAGESAEGKVATSRVNTLVAKKQADGTQKATQLQAAQQKLEAGGSVMSENARGALQKDIDRMTTEIQRFNEDAEKEVQALQAELQGEFQAKLTPIIQQVARERDLYAIFSLGDSGLVWGDPGLDLTADVIKRFDSAAPATAAARPAAAPAASRPPAAAAPKPN